MVSERISALDYLASLVSHLRHHEGLSDHLHSDIENAVSDNRILLSLGSLIVRMRPFHLN
jgi:hypothetical protein